MSMFTLNGLLKQSHTDLLIVGPKLSAKEKADFIEETAKAVRNCMKAFHTTYAYSPITFVPMDPDLGGAYEDVPDVGMLWLDNRMMSCCNKAGRETWNGKTVQWECSACGAPKSNDPNFLFKTYTPGGARASDPVTIKPEVKSGPQCECGSEKVGSDKHSHYCPKA